MMEIEVTVSVKDLEKLTAEVQKMAEDVRAKIASGEIKAEPEIEPEALRLPRLHAASWTRDPVHRKANRHHRKVRTAPSYVVGLSCESGFADPGHGRPAGTGSVAAVSTVVDPGLVRRWHRRWGALGPEGIG